MPRGAGTSLAGGGLPGRRRRDDRAHADARDPRGQSPRSLRRRRARRRQRRVSTGTWPAPAFTTRPTLRARARARSAATSARTPAGRTRSNTASRSITCSALEIVTAEGDIVHIGGPAEDSPGLDLVGTIVGSEGTLGDRHQDLGPADAQSAGRPHDARRVRFGRRLPRRRSAASSARASFRPRSR